MVLNVVLFRYGQSCQAAIAPDAVWGACDPAVTVTLSALQPDVPAVGTKYLTCMYQAQTQTCSIRVACKSCKVLSDASAFVFVAAQPSSTAQAIQWNLTFTTGIQTFAQPFVDGGQISTLAADIVAPPGFAFRGSTPSIVSLSILPSNYVPSTAGLVAGNGYLAQYNDSTLGSYLPPSQSSLTTGFRFQLRMRRDAATFLTLQVPRFNGEQTLAQVAGMMVGVWACFRALMRALETRLEKPTRWAVFRDSRRDVMIDKEFGADAKKDEGADGPALKVKSKRTKRSGKRKVEVTPDGALADVFKTGAADAAETDDALAHQQQHGASSGDDGQLDQKNRVLTKTELLQAAVAASAVASPASGAAAGGKDTFIVYQNQLPVDQSISRPSAFARTPAAASVFGGLKIGRS
jgi:hypothetical protein